jgi:CBS domain-containing protein
MAIVTKQHFRQLPVVDGNTVVGVVSSGDLVKWIIAGQERTVYQAGSYITETYSG